MQFPLRSQNAQIGMSRAQKQRCTYWKTRLALINWKTAFSKFPEVKRSQPDGKTEVYDVEKAAGQLVNVYEFVDLGRLIKADLQRWVKLAATESKY